MVIMKWGLQTCPWSTFLSENVNVAKWNRINKFCSCFLMLLKAISVQLYYMTKPLSISQIWIRSCNTIFQVWLFQTKIGWETHFKCKWTCLANNCSKRNSLSSLQPTAYCVRRHSQEWHRSRQNTEHVYRHLKTTCVCSSTTVHDRIETFSYSLSVNRHINI